MKKSIKKKWVTALRSGKYKQATGLLRVDDAFCCLGVLCNLHAQEHPLVAATQSSPELYLGEDRILPEEVRRWAGLKNSYGADVRIGWRFDGLTRHNDTGNSFHAIADAIEAQL
jgi:hypothetical protein